MNLEGKHFSQERVMNIGTVVQVIGPVVDVEF
jgi:rRNA processing protein Gar1